MPKPNGEEEAIDYMMITLYEAPGENISFGQGEAHRTNAVAHA